MMIFLLRSFRGYFLLSLRTMKVIFQQEDKLLKLVSISTSTQEEKKQEGAGASRSVQRAACVQRPAARKANAQRRQGAAAIVLHGRSNWHNNKTVGRRALPAPAGEFKNEQSTGNQKT